MGNVWNWDFKFESNLRRAAARELQLVALLSFALTLQLSAPTSAKTASVLGAHDQSNGPLQVDVERHPARRMEIQDAHFSRPQSHISMTERMKTTVVKDRRKEYAIQAKLYGEPNRFESELADSDAVSLPVSIPDPNFFAYVTRIKIGTPPREFWAVPDTGSDLVWVQCDPCSECLPQPVFQTNTSASYTRVPCTNSFCSYLHALGSPTSCTTTGTGRCSYNFTYGSGETSGELSTEILTLNSQTGGVEEFPGFVFGCAHQSAAVLRYPILGLSRGELSLASQLGAKTAMKKAFSFCFPAYFENKTTELVVGSNGTANLSYTPLVPSVYYYRANVTGISVDGVLVNISNGAFNVHPDGSGGVIIDTGTSFTILVPEVYAALRLAVESKVSYRSINGSREGLDLCYDVTTVNATSLDRLGLPAITFHFQSLDLHLPVNNTFFHLQDDISLLACMTIIPSRFGLSIFGNYQMQNHYFFFDSQNERVGIKAEAC